MALFASALAVAPFLYQGALALPQLIVPHVEEHLLNITSVATTTVYTDSASGKCVSPAATPYDEEDPAFTTVTVTVTTSTSMPTSSEEDEPVLPTTEPPYDEEDPQSPTVTATATSTSMPTSSEEDEPISPTAEPPYDEEDPASPTVTATAASTSMSTSTETDKPVSSTEPPYDEQDPANPSVTATGTVQTLSNQHIPTYYLGPATYTITLTPTATTTSRYYWTPPSKPGMEGTGGTGMGMPPFGFKMRRDAAAPTTETPAPSWDYHYGVPPVVTSIESAHNISRRHMEPPEDSSKTALPTTQPTGEPSALLPPRPAFPAVSTMDSGDVTFGDRWSVTVGSDAAPRSEEANNSDADEDADEDVEEDDDESTQEQNTMEFSMGMTMSGHISDTPQSPTESPEEPMPTITLSMGKTLSGHIVGRPTPATVTVTESITPTSTRAQKTCGSGSTLRTLKKTTTTSSTQTTTSAPAVARRELVTTNGLVYDDSEAADCTPVVVRVRGARSTVKGCPPAATAAAPSRSHQLSEECHHRIRNGTTHPRPPHCMNSINSIDV